MQEIEAYALMLRIRFFEEAIERLFLEGRIMGTAHTCIGQEAVAVGVAAALGPEDAMTTTHRGHGHLLARGADPGRAMAELFGRVSGYSRGRGGSQMMMVPEIGFYGSNGITGGSIPFATGIALNAKLQRSRRVTICFYGDGAANQGVCHESLNMAALWQLPVIYLVENNGYAMSTATAAGLANPRIVERAAGYGMEGARLDGNDFRAVRDALKGYVRQVRAGGGPMLVECLTYRLSGHSRGDARVYRARSEEEQAWRNDPVARLERQLLADGITEEALEDARREARGVIAAAIDFAEHSALPAAENLQSELFATDEDGLAV